MRSTVIWPLHHPPRRADGDLRRGRADYGRVRRRQSETAIELVKRGHRLIADDAVEISRISDMLTGTAPGDPPLYRLRGIGVVDVRRLFWHECG